MFTYKVILETCDEKPSIRLSGGKKNITLKMNESREQIRSINRADGAVMYCARAADGVTTLEYRVGAQVLKGEAL